MFFLKGLLHALECIASEAHMKEIVVESFALMFLTFILVLTRTGDKGCPEGPDVVPWWKYAPKSTPCMVFSTLIP